MNLRSVGLVRCQRKENQHGSRVVAQLHLSMRADNIARTRFALADSSFLMSLRLSLSHKLDDVLTWLIKSLHGLAQSTLSKTSYLSSKELGASKLHPATNIE